jgi:hypothetical protein
MIALLLQQRDSLNFDRHAGGKRGAGPQHAVTGASLVPEFTLPLGSQLPKFGSKNSRFTRGDRRVTTLHSTRRVEIQICRRAISEETLGAI